MIIYSADHSISDGRLTLTKKYAKETKREISFFSIARIFSGVESFRK